MKDKFNKDFEDFGWSEMQKILDHELPVADKKRRRGLVFWLFLIGSLTALGVYELKIKNLELNVPIKNVVIKNDNSNLIKNEIKNDNSDLINNDIKNNNSTLINNDIKNDNSALINNEVKNDNLALINNDIKNDNSNLINEKLKNNNSALINNEIKNNNELNFNFNTPPQYFNEKMDTYPIINYTEEIAKQVITVEQVFALTNEPLKEIKSDSMAINDLKSINPLTKYALIKPIFPTKTHWGVTIGVNTEVSKIVNGWQLGAVINHVFKPKLSISAGLNYRKTQVNGNAPLTYYQVEKNAAYTPQSALVPVKKIVLNQLNYIELPVTINYHFNRKWSVSTGIKAAYLVGAGIATSSDSTLFVLQTGNSTNDPSLFAKDQSRGNISALGLQRWDFAAIGGLNFKPTKRLELSLRYDFGLKNVLNQASWSAYNRFIGLNATYYFK